MDSVVSFFFLRESIFIFQSQLILRDFHYIWLILSGGLITSTRADQILPWIRCVWPVGVCLEAEKLFNELKMVKKLSNFI